MKKLFSSGFILMESLVAFTLLTGSILFLIQQQMVFLRQIQSMQIEVQDYRYLYEEVQAQQPNLDQQPIVVQEGAYQITFYRKNNFYGVKLKGSDGEMEIYREK